MLRIRVILSFTLLLACATSVADEPDAKSLFMRGRTAYALGRFSEAADLFEKAFELKQDPAILYNAAQAHRLAGDKKKALVLYQNYLRLFGEPENSTEVEHRISELKAAIDAEQKANTNPPTDLMTGKTEPAPSAAPSLTPSPTTPALVATATHARENKPLAKRGWFWGVVVGGAVVVGGVVALGVVLGAKHQDPIPTLGTVGAN